MHYESDLGHDTFSYVGKAALTVLSFLNDLKFPSADPEVACNDRIELSQAESRCVFQEYQEPSLPVLRTR